MRTVVSSAAAALVALVLAALAAYGVVQANTSSPSTNPAGDNHDGNIGSNSAFYGN